MGRKSPEEEVYVKEFLKEREVNPTPKLET